MGFRNQEFAFESPSAAVAALIARIPPQRSARAESTPLQAARGRFLAEPVFCDRDSPPFDHAAMDGYAVRTADLAAAADRAKARDEPFITLAVIAESRIGLEPPTFRTELGTPHAIRIATGSPIPTDPSSAERRSIAIIKREDVSEHADASSIGMHSISVPCQVAERVCPGDHIRNRGENAHAGDCVLPAGRLLTPSSIGALAAVGRTSPQVYRPLRVALLTTGDELVTPESVPNPYQIRNSNAPSVAATLAAHPWLSVVAAEHLPDDADLAGAIRTLVSESSAADAIIITGGVSMGHRDPVRSAIESLGATIVFHGLPQRPGKPMLAALLTATDRTLPVFGLPGNPVSAMVTCVRVVLPVLASCAGATTTPATLLPRLVSLQNDDHRRVPLWWHRLVRLIAAADGTTCAELIDTGGSGDLISAAQSDGFVELPPSASSVPAAPNTSLIPFYPWSP